MTEILGWARPWLLVALALVPIWLIWRRRVHRASLLPFAPLQLHSGAAPKRLLSTVVIAIESLLLIVVIAALAGPYRETRLELIEDEGIDVALVLDVSLSMLAEDLEPNRLEALRTIARDFVTRSGNNRLGIVVFAGDPFVHTPLTQDHASLSELLDDVTVYTLDQADSGGTAIGDALLVAAQRLVASRVEDRDQSIILITDGENNQGIEPELAARWAAEESIRIHTVGVGDTEPIPVFFEGRPVGRSGSYVAALDDRELRAIAQAANGRFFRATDAGALEEIFAELSRLEQGPLESRTVIARRFFSSWLALGALLLYVVHLALAGLWLRRPWR